MANLLGMMLLALTPPSARAQIASLPPVRPLGPIEARAPGTFASLRGLRFLSDGRVLVSDHISRQLVLVDSTLAKLRVFLDSGSANPKQSYTTYPRGSTHGMLAPFAGDSTLFVDLPSGSYLVISPDGDVGRVIALGPYPRLAASGTHIDLLGRFLFRGVVRNATYAELPTRKNPRDSVPLVRQSPVLTDTITWIRVPIDWGFAQYGNPVPVNDDYTVLPDGGVAVIRALDFSVEWYAVDGRRLSTTRLQYDWRPLNDATKQALVDSLHGWYTAHPLAMGLSLGGPNSYRYYPAYVPDPVPTAALPDYAPPFSDYTAKADADDRVWLRVLANGELPQGVFNNPQSSNRPPSMRPATGPPTYYVFDRTGKVVDRVQLPAGWQLAGFGPNGKVFLSRPSTPTQWELARARFR